MYLKQSDLVKECFISKEMILEHLSYDKNTGVFLWIKDRRGTARSGHIAGSVTCGYLQINVLGFKVYAHRLAWFLVHGKWPPNFVDHVNGDGLDNRICNLRLATVQQNAYNRRKRKNNKAGIKGIYYDKSAGKWRAQICKDGRRRHIGSFDTAETATDAYRVAAQSAFEEYAEHVSRSEGGA